MTLPTAGEGILGCGRSRLEALGEGDLDTAGEVLGGEERSDGDRDDGDLDDAGERGDSGDRGDNERGDRGDRGEWWGDAVGDEALGSGTGR